ncbi:uncharacterized protein FIBRA_07553 [Fibroporia radiculosa]|uniref:Uncharacterized protein n=1 Tax=Fibroporia radiculosa TaxID=599839 RepID=J4H4P3_9APHY|nr:uncharacterized protein FIBRA_07553 [Fibroporia radiculosa]CCM05339.1 predicted protein [Fibroporia radiculosa]
MPIPPLPLPSPPSPTQTLTTFANSSTSTITSLFSISGIDVYSYASTSMTSLSLDDALDEEDEPFTPGLSVCSLSPLSNADPLSPVDSYFGTTSTPSLRVFPPEEDDVSEKLAATRVYCASETSRRSRTSTLPTLHEDEERHRSFTPSPRALTIILGICIAVPRTPEVRSQRDETDTTSALACGPAYLPRSSRAPDVPSNASLWSTHRSPVVRVFGSDHSHDSARAIRYRAVWLVLRPAIRRRQRNGRTDNARTRPGADASDVVSHWPSASGGTVGLRLPCARSETLVPRTLPEDLPCHAQQQRTHIRCGPGVVPALLATISPSFDSSLCAWLVGGVVGLLSRVMASGRWFGRVGISRCR